MARPKCAAIPAVLFLSCSTAALADNRPNVNSIFQIVELQARQQTDWKYAREREGLDAGHKIRTDIRARATISFPVEGAAIKLDQLSCAVINGPRSANLIKVPRGCGRVYLNAGAKGGVETDHGTVVATAGSTVEIDSKTGATHVRADTGFVVASADVAGGLHAGQVQSPTSTSFTDPSLIGDTRSWVGAKLRFFTGNEERTIVSLDRETGTATYDRPLTTPMSAGTSIYLTLHPELTIVVPPGMQTYFHAGSPPAALQAAPPPAYSDLSTLPWWQQIVDNSQIDVYPGSLLHDQDRMSDWPIGNSILYRSNSGPLFPNGSLSGGIGRGPQRSRFRTTPMAGQRGGYGGVWEIVPYGSIRDQTDTGGGRTQLRIVSGRFMIAAGGAYTDYPGDPQLDLGELFAVYRSPNLGDLTVGRQHIFLGPVNNGRQGALINFDTADAAIWSFGKNKTVGWRAGYLRDTSPLRGQGYEGWFGRVNGTVLHGLWGVTVLNTSYLDGGFGASADLCLPLIPHRVDVYVEAGRDPFNNDLATGGLYFAGLLRPVSMDAFLEVQHRRGFEDNVSLFLRTEIRKGWFINASAIQQLRGRTSGGLSISHRWDLN